MKLAIEARLDYRFDHPADVLLQIEAAAIPEQAVEEAQLEINDRSPITRVAGHDMIGDRIWIRVSDRLDVRYRAKVAIHRTVDDRLDLAATPLTRLPGPAIQYLMGSRYCQPDLFHPFVSDEFGGLEGGAMVLAMRDWIHRHLVYTPGASSASTTAADTFVSRRGVCRDYAHLLIAFVRAAGIPARIASVYALGVKPQDFHAVAEVFLGGEWHLVDPTMMAHEAAMAKIGVGRDAADVAFMTAYETATLFALAVTVDQVP